MTRDRSIYVSAKHYWLLIRVVRATNAVLSEQTPATIDSVIETIIDQWAQKNCPKLFELWDKRQELDEQAEKLI